ncbi:MAG: cation:proton antiporter [Anaerolineales bacterium]
MDGITLLGGWFNLLPAAGGEGANAFLDLAIALVFIIAAAKLGGYLSVRIKQPAVLGELLVGLLLGPSLLDFLHWGVFFQYDQKFTYEMLVSEIHQLAEIGVLLLMFVAGLELHLSDLIQSRRVAILAGTLGVFFPLGLGYFSGVLFGGNAVDESIFLGLILSATSVSISAQTLLEMGRLRSRVGIGLLGAAVLDDVLVVLGVSIFFAIWESGGGGLGDIALIFLRMVLFIALAVGFGVRILPRITTLIERLPISRGLLAFVFVTMLLYAWLAEIIGHMAPITGAFLAGLMFSRSPLKQRIETQIASVAYGVFVPIFFVSVGLAADMRLLTLPVLGLMLVVTLVAIFGKVLGCGLGARLAGFDNRQALQMGVGMMSRGEVGLIVANQGVAVGLIHGETFTVVIGVVLLTTLFTPPLLRRLFQNEPKPESGAAAAI